MSPHKYNYGIIGNCAYLALVDTHANVGWLCWPRFDSSFIFGTLLDQQEGGRFSIQPENGGYTSTQRYIENTNVLETTFEGESGNFRVIDFAPRFYQYERYYKPLMLVRKVEPISGTPKIKVQCQPVGDYGKVKPEHELGSSHIRYLGLQRQVRLTTNVPLNYVLNEQSFVLNEPKHFILTWGIPLEGALETTAEDFLQKTLNYWNTWVKNTGAENFHQEKVIRSALVLKLHQYEDTGAIIASATTSLPESPGSGRNWDYRYCWLRDAHYTLQALNGLSHFSELERYAEFIENIALSEGKRYNPLYSVAINGLLKEEILPLAGYLGNQPVRIGNQANEHIQNDVYGQVLVTLLPLFSDQRLVNKDKANIKSLIVKILKLIELTMQEPDNGLWEFREKKQLHAYTYLFHWAGSHAALIIAKLTNDKAMSILAKKLIKESAKMIEACYDEKRGVYTQALGSENLDASLLKLINMGYLNPHSKRARQHLKVLEDSLKVGPGLFYRYTHDDDFGKPESTFMICAFWYVEALARVGRLKEAIKTFETVTGYANHLGLMSEDVDYKTGSQWGNFPQTYSHVGLVNAAFNIGKRIDKPIFLI